MIELDCRGTTCLAKTGLEFLPELTIILGNNYQGLHTMLDTAKAIAYTIISTDQSGNSCFRSGQEALLPAKLGSITKMLAVNTMFFGEGPEQEQDWHNPQQRLFIVVLSGIIQIEASNGELKNFNPGEILLAEDLTGKGHKTRNLSKEPVLYLAIPH
jgi:hypothetical protein